MYRLVEMWYTLPRIWSVGMSSKTIAESFFEILIIFHTSSGFVNCIWDCFVARNRIWDRWDYPWGVDKYYIWISFLLRNIYYYLNNGLIYLHFSTHFWLMFRFNTPWKFQKTKSWFWVPYSLYHISLFFVVIWVQHLFVGHCWPLETVDK